MLYEITNNGTATRIFHNSNGRSVNVRSGETVSVMLTSKQRDRVLRDAALSVQHPVNSAEPKLPPIEPDPPADVPKSTAEQAQELLTMSEGKFIDFPQFFVKSKALIGDKWPGRVPKKMEIRRMLQELIDEPGV